MDGLYRGVLDPACPIEWSHPLNRGLVADWTIPPNSGWRGGSVLRDLVRGGKKPNDGTLTNGPTWAAGPNGFGAIVFDGANDYVTAPGPAFGSGDFAVTAWLNPTDFGNNRAVYDTLAVGGSGTRSNDVVLYVEQSSGAPKGFTSGGFLASGTVALTAAQWNHVVWSRSGTTLSYYVNGRSAGTATLGTNITGANANLGVFSDAPTGTGTPFNNWIGRIGGVWVHNRSLSAVEVSGFYSQSRRGNPDRYRWLRPWSFGVTQEAGGGGGTEHQEDYAGSCTPSGALSHQQNKGLTGSSTGSGSLAKAIAQALTGSSTGTSSLHNTAGKSYSGSLTGSGAVTQAIGKGLTGSLTATSTFTKAVAQALAGSCSPSGTPANAVSKPFSGSVTGEGSLSNTLVAPLNATGSCTPSGALSNAKSAAHNPTGSVTSSGSVSFAVSKALAGSCTPAGLATRTFQRPFAGSLTAEGALTNAPNTGLQVGGSLTGSGVLTKQPAKTLTGRCQGYGLLYGDGVLLDQDGNTLLLLGV